ncbi:UNVERIFIED_CONTAM: hypothetical protein NCL1_29043 [Trichonephila clavipes]
MFAKFKPGQPSETNPITQYYEIGRQIGSAGPELVWKIYEAVRKSDKRRQQTLLGVFPSSCQAALGVMPHDIKLEPHSALNGYKSYKLLHAVKTRIEERRDMKKTAMPEKK